MQNESWLPHLTNEMMIGARNNNLCSYVIALEGWRRGLTLTFYSRKVKNNTLHVPGCLFSLSDGKTSHMFYKSRGMRVKNEAFSVGDKKILTKKALEKSGIPVPKGEVFSKEIENEDIIAYANKIGYPIVLKPANAAQGKGVITNINDGSFLRKSLKHVREELKYEEVIIEEHITGKEYRVYVMEDNVISVLNRIPANVVGDGKHTINELIKMKNKERRKNPRLFSCLIKVDFEIKNILSENGLTLNSIPKDNELIYLRGKSNISSGGDSVDVTDEFPNEVKRVAINALKQIPNFPNGGVDIMIDDTKPIDQAAKVIELTPVPQIGSLVFPMKGKGRDIPSAIIDFYFPETKEFKNSNPNIHFDLRDVLAPLNSKSASEVTVIPCPDYIEKQTIYVIEGDVQGVGFRRWIRKKALEADLFGYAQNQLDGTLSIAVAGEERSVSRFIKVCEQGPKSANVINVTENSWEGAVKVGFEIKKNLRKKKTVEKVINEPAKKPAKPISFLGKVKRRLKG